MNHAQFQLKIRSEYPATHVDGELRSQCFPCNAASAAATAALV